MNMENFCKRKQIALNLHKIVEGIIKKTPPLDRIPLLPQCKSFYYRKYLQYESELPADLKKKVLLAVLDFSKYMVDFDMGIPSVGGTYRKKYPHHIETEAVFEEWVKAKERNQIKSQLTDRSSSEKVAVSYLAKKLMKDRMPDYSYQKGVIKHLQVPFVKKINNESSLIINLDTGKVRLNSFSAQIGLSNPAFVVDVAIFCAWSQSWFEFYNEKEFIEQLNLALDFIELILPYFEDAVNE